MKVVLINLLIFALAVGFSFLLEYIVCKIEDKIDKDD